MAAIVITDDPADVQTAQLSIDLEACIRSVKNKADYRRVGSYTMASCAQEHSYQRSNKPIASPLYDNESKRRMKSAYKTPLKPEDGQAPIPATAAPNTYPLCAVLQAPPSPRKATKTPVALATMAWVLEAGPPAATVEPHIATTASVAKLGD